MFATHSPFLIEVRGEYVASITEFHINLYIKSSITKGIVITLFFLPHDDIIHRFFVRVFQGD